MLSHSLNSQQRRITDLFAEVENASNQNLELQAHWARYMCVLVAGFLENAIGEIYSEFARSSSSPQASSFISKIVLRIQNPKSSRFVEVAAQFRKEWGEGLQAYLDEDGRGDAINSIMNNRNQIVHGRQVGVSLTNVFDYFVKSIGVVEFIEEQCGLSSAY